jgi:arylsulfatase A-like enzyme
MYNPDEVPDPTPAPAENRHLLHEVLLQHRVTRAPRDPACLRKLRAQYYGMISEVDHQLGRVWDWLRSRGQWDRTVVVVTSDHGEQLGDQGLLQKAGFFEASYHVAGIVRHPLHPATHGTVVERFTENVDILPTLCAAMGLAVPAQCDGFPLTPFLEGSEPPVWRDAAHYEFDWRDAFLPDWVDDWPWNRRLEQQHLAVRRSDGRAYVHFGDSSWRCFDLAADPTWRTEITDPAVVLAEAQAMLDWRAGHMDRTMTGMLLRDGGIGRFPPALAPRNGR